MAGVVTATGPLGAGGWSSALGLLLRALGGFGIQGFLVLPPLLVLLPVPSGSLLLPRRRTAAALQGTLFPRFAELLFDHVPYGDDDCSARRAIFFGSRHPQSRRGAAPRRACLDRSRPSSACGGSSRRILLPAASLPLPAGGRRPYPRGDRSSRACRLRTGGCCGGNVDPTPMHAAGTQHGGGAAATSCPPLASSSWERVPQWILRSSVGACSPRWANPWGWLLKRLLRSTLSTGLGPRRPMVVVEVGDAARSVASTGRPKELDHVGVLIATLLSRTRRCC